METTQTEKKVYQLMFEIQVQANDKTSSIALNERDKETAGFQFERQVKKCIKDMLSSEGPYSAVISMYSATMYDMGEHITKPVHEKIKEIIITRVL